MDTIFIVGFNERTYNINFERDVIRTCTIQDFKNEVSVQCEIEVEHQTLLFCGRELKNTEDGKVMHLLDYGITDRSSVMMIIILPEAAKCALETRKVKLCDIRTAADFIYKRDQERTVLNHPKGECCICREEDNLGLLMKCGHYFCPNDLLDCAWLQVKVQKYEIGCSTCGRIIDIEDIIKLGLPEDDERQLLTTAISVNYCASQDIQQCPGCRSYCQRLQPNQVQTNCAVCSRNMKLTYLFCWYCLRDWKNPRSEQICGNDNCSKDKIELLKKSPMIELTGKQSNITFPKLRACPHCFSIVTYENGCIEATCKQCKYAFCIICLIPQRGGSLICKTGQIDNIVCVPAPIQTRFRVT